MPSHEQDEPMQRTEHGTHRVVCLQKVLSVGAHVAVAAQMGGPNHTLLTVCTQLAFCVPLARHDQAHWEPAQRLPSITELAHFQTRVIGFGGPGALACRLFSCSSPLRLLIHAERSQARFDRSILHSLPVVLLVFFLHSLPSSGLEHMIARVSGTAGVQQ